MKHLQKIILLLAVFTVAISSYAQESTPYQVPDLELLELAMAPLPASPLILSKKNKIVLLDRNKYKSIRELGESELRLAGLRINPDLNISSIERYFSGISVLTMGEKEPVKFTQFPDDSRISNISTSPDQAYVAFTLVEESGVSLWILDIDKIEVKKISAANLNCNLGRPFSWVGNTGKLIVSVMPEKRQPLINKEKELPTGPRISTNDGEKAQNRTYQDLLKDQMDESNFQVLVTSELKLMDVNGNSSDWMPASMYSRINVSPDGKYVLVSLLDKPFSYLVPYYRFPTVTSVYGIDAKLVAEIRNRPLLEVLPKGSNATETGRRSIGWRNDKAATLSWIEALDGGDPENKVDYRDALYELEYPFSGDGTLLMKTVNRFSQVMWGNDQLAIAVDYWISSRNTKTYLFSPSAKSNVQSKIIFDRNYQDLYSDPGEFITDKNELGEYVLVVDKTNLYLTGDGQTSDGMKPFISKYNYKIGKTEEIYRMKNETELEKIVSVVDIKKGEILTSIQQPTVYPNYYMRNIKKGQLQQLTFSENPFKSLGNIKKELVKYRRDDGLELSATMYLPADYDVKSGKKLPMIMWAYPQEFKDKSSAGQVRSDKNEFIYVSYGSPVMWVKKGYLIMDDAAFPIVGEGDEEPNDTFVKQLVANAKAAIDFADSLGYVDRSKVAVGGHSYGAFMTANLLSHSDLFACGVARSGAYNRTLTPFGFQNEERSYWEAPNVYNTMSPFMNAEKMKHPLLLIHGEADNNSGTFPMQSERYFNALKGLGATTRLVILPLEAHGYVAKESVLHVLWEQDQWFEKYLK